MATCCERRSWTCCSWVTRSERGPENAALCRFGERVRFRRALLGEGVTRQQLDVCLFERMAHTQPDLVAVNTASTDLMQADTGEAQWLGES